MSAPIVSISTPRREPSSARSGLVEGLHLESRLFWPARVATPANLSERLTDSYGLARRHYRVHVADLELSFSRYQAEDRFRLDEIYAFTNPQLWKREALAAPPGGAEPGYLLFDVPYDEDEVVYTMGDRAELVFDEQNARLRSRFAERGAEGRWIGLADTLFAVVDGRELLALQFEAFTIGENPA
ncbi:hypothetical protein GCM10017083_09160 [Thalassobaculum fulvum]|uniref:Uncharacterized protein n=1 Tax=Thalassobaculum fulvum TaxID=1633335 RepID=A0A919CN58_9PROT|nr:hypothetical protein [Thalassobaculum fulvum]GHD43266.1 hypothetical protein GCM10017083_09160 [Thalassobaculum fulvum]